LVAFGTFFWVAACFAFALFFVAFVFFRFTASVLVVCLACSSFFSLG
jgi:hypothetical protein